MATKEPQIAQIATGEHRLLLAMSFHESWLRRLAFDLSGCHVLFSLLLLVRFCYVSLMGIILYLRLDFKLILTADVVKLEILSTKSETNSKCECSNDQNEKESRMTRIFADY